VVYVFIINKAFEIEGQSVELITITNDSNMEVKLLSYGAAIVELLVPDRDNVAENVVLAYQNLEDYIQNSPYFGVTLGRTSGRIREGLFYMDEKIYKLDKNFGVNHGHGGVKGFSHRIWSYNIKEADNGIAVEFKYKSPDGEEGYPGELDTKVVYTLRHDNTLIITYEAETDKKTLCNLTNHSYFNLSGNYKSKITEQFLRINSKSFLELDNTLIPTGKQIQVKDTPMDFSSRKLIGKDIKQDYEQLKVGNGYDHPWLLEGKKDHVEMYDSRSGRKMTITSTCPSVVVYSFNFPNDEKLKYGKTAEKHDGICFETQNEPDGINSEHFNKSVLQPGEKYYEKTEFRFSVE
jgi:aldose 1-epimerase